MLSVAVVSVPEMVDTLTDDHTTKCMLILVVRSSVKLKSEMDVNVEYVRIPNCYASIISTRIRKMVT